MEKCDKCNDKGHYRIPINRGGVTMACHCGSVKGDPHDYIDESLYEIREKEKFIKHLQDEIKLEEEVIIRLLLKNDIDFDVLENNYNVSKEEITKIKEIAKKGTK